MTKLFIGMEETNIGDFISPCCKCGLSIEPLCRVACGQCGKTIKHEDAIYDPDTRTPEDKGDDRT